MTFNDGRNEDQGMDDKRLRAVIREEIALAFRALKAGAEANDWAYETPEMDSRALENVKRSADSAAGAFEELCAKADEQRAADAENPFEEAAPTVDQAVKAFVYGEVVNVLREMRDTFNMSGLDDDSRIAERLTFVADNYERTAQEFADE